MFRLSACCPWMQTAPATSVCLQEVRRTHVSEEAAADGKGRMAAGLQLLQEVPAVEVAQLLHVAEHRAALSPQVLGQVGPLHLREVVLDYVVE